MRELLSAAVDGDLDGRDRGAVQRLLRESDEARTLFQALKRDARRLHDLPRKQLPAHFASQVLQSIGQTSQTIPAAVASAAQKYLPMWANLAAAASILLALSVGTYLVVALNEEQKTKQAAENKVKAPESMPSPLHPGSSGTQLVRAGSLPASSHPDELPLPREEDIAAVEMPDLPDAPEPKGKSVLTVPFSPKYELFRIEMPKLPPILPVRELDQAAHKAMLVDTLRADESIHLDLFCKDANRSFERVQALLKAQGKRVIVETVAQQRLQARVKTNYVFFTESMSADEITKLFAALAPDERKFEAKQSDKVVVAPMSANSQRTLAALLGIHADALLTRPKPSPALDPQKPLSDSTAEKLEKVLADKARTGGPVATTARSDGPVIALSFNPVRPNPQLSKEVREFLAARKERKAGAVSLMLVIRNMD